MTGEADGVVDISEAVAGLPFGSWPTCPFPSNSADWERGQDWGTWRIPQR